MSPLWEALLEVHHLILLLIQTPWVTLLRQEHHHTALYLSVWDILLTIQHHILLIISPCEPNVFYKTILHPASLLTDTPQAVHHILLLIQSPWVTLLQVHHHAALCFSAIGQTARSTSSYSTLNSSPVGHASSIRTSPYSTLRRCHGTHC